MNSIPLLVVPDADEPDAAEIYIDGTVNGRNYRFLLDTGAARSSIGLDEFTAALPSVGENWSSGVFSQTADDIVVVDSLRVGPLLRAPFQFTRSKERAHAARSNLLGMDLWREVCCHFRFDCARLDILPTPPTDAFTFQPIHMDQKAHPYLPIQIAGAVGMAVWDTGASLTVVDASFVRANARYFTEAATSLGTDASGTQVETPMFVMADSRIDGHLFPPHRVAAVDLSAVNATLEVPMDLILGYNLYHQANWLFDFPRRRWAISG